VAGNVVRSRQEVYLLLDTIVLAFTDVNTTITALIHTNACRSDDDNAIVVTEGGVAELVGLLALSFVITN